MYQSENARIYHFMEKIEIPREKLVDVTASLASNEWPESLPKLLAVVLQIPKAGAAGMGSFLSSDAPGYFLVTYFTPSLEFVASVRAIENGEKVEENAVRLALNWLRMCDKNAKLRRKLKIMAGIYNYEKTGLPSICGKFNGKPAMVKDSLTIFRDMQKGYLELDIDMRANNILVNRAITSMIPKSLLDISFALTLIVQGEEVDELPERFFSAIQFQNIDARDVPFWPFE